MDRASATAKLERMIGAIEAGATPAAVQELYVFGSYARGAMAPNDLDIVVIHGQPPKKLMAELEKKWRAGQQWSMDLRRSPEQRFRALMRKALVTPGERVDLFAETSLERITDRWRDIKVEELVLLWSTEDRRWREKLASIRPDRAAGTAPRNQFISPKRAGCRPEEVEEVTATLDDGRLVLERVALANVEVQLNARHRRLLATLSGAGWSGRATARLLPYAIQWLQGRGVVKWYYGRTEFISSDNRFRAQLGNLDLFAMLDAFHRQPKLREQCLIPHLKRAALNEMLIFRKGQKWPKPKRRQKKTARGVSEGPDLLK